MTPEEQTAMEFDIRRRERAELDNILAEYGLDTNRRLQQAIDGYATACARAAIAIMQETQSKKKP